MSNGGSTWGEGWQMGGRTEEWHLMSDNVQMMIAIPPKYAASRAIGYMIGKSVIRLFRLYADTYNLSRGMAHMKKLNIFGWRSTTCVLAITALLSGLSASVSASNSSIDTKSKGGELADIKVTTFPQSSFLSVWVAQKLGFAEKRNVKITDVSTSGGNTLYTPLVGGQADASIILPELAVQFADKGIVASKTGRMVVLPALTVKATESHPATAIVVRKGIQNVDDLVGKTIATHNRVSGFFTLAKATLQNAGVRIDDNDPHAAHTIVLPMGLMANALRLGKIDAAIMDYYTASAAVASGAGRILMPVMGAGEWVNYPYALWAFNRNFYDSSQTVIQNFLLALLDANQWILNNPKEAKLILASKLGTSAELAAKFLPAYPMDGYTTNLQVNIGETSFPKLYELLKSAGTVKNIRPLDTIFEPTDLVQQTQRIWSSEPNRVKPSSPVK